MSKNDTLLKKAEFFEKLALYSDRTAFLQAIAQSPSDLKSQLNSIVNDLSALNINDPKIMNPLLDATQSATPVNKFTLLYPLSQAAAKIPRTPEHVAQLQRIQSLLNLLKGNSSETASTEETFPEMVMPADRIKAYPPIAPEVQNMLNEILFPYEKIPVPLKMDGQLGPDTRKAMEVFTQTYGLPATPKNIRQTYWKVVHPGVEPNNPF